MLAERRLFVLLFLWNTKKHERKIYIILIECLSTKKKKRHERWFIVGSSIEKKVIEIESFEF